MGTLSETALAELWWCGKECPQCSEKSAELSSLFQLRVYVRTNFPVIPQLKQHAAPDGTRTGVSARLSPASSEKGTLLPFCSPLVFFGKYSFFRLKM